MYRGLPLLVSKSNSVTLRDALSVLSFSHLPAESLL